MWVFYCLCVVMSSFDFFICLEEVPCVCVWLCCGLTQVCSSLFVVQIPPMPHAPSVPPSVLVFCRPVMTKLVGVDILSPDFDTETAIQHPAGKPFMLAFVNIADNGGILTAGDGTPLKSSLTFLSNNLHDRGTVVVALPDWEFNRTKLKGDPYHVQRVVLSIERWE